MSNKYRIILVDDDEDILWINQISLSQEGYTVDTSDDSEEALDLMISDPYDVAILDYMMPKMRGDELAIKISELQLGTEIVFLTGYSEFAVYMENTGNVRSTVLLKPVESKDLLDAVRSKLERKALIADLKTPSRIRTL